MFCLYFIINLKKKSLDVESRSGKGCCDHSDESRVVHTDTDEYSQLTEIHRTIMSVKEIKQRPLNKTI